MRNNIFVCVCAAFVLAAGIELKAQDLDPTVVVDRAYEGKLVEFSKPSLEMSVPDSVMRFDLDFDYSVFANPYKGSYEFNPYLLSMKPDVASEEAGRFYLRAGAGYQLHPELDLVWSPVMGKTSESFSLDVYARHRSFIGKYHDITFIDGLATSEKGRYWKGYDLDTKAGAIMEYDWKSGKLGMTAGYYGLHQKDQSWNRAYNAVDVSFDLSSKNQEYDSFVYGISADYRYAHDHTALTSSQERIIGGHDLSVDATIGSGLKKGGAFHLDFGMDLAGYKGYVGDVAAGLYVTPKYLYRKGVLSAELGLKVQAVVGDTTTFVRRARQQFVYPDIAVRLNLLPKYLALFVNAGGGAKVESYSSLLQKNRHINIAVPAMTTTDPEDDIFGYRMGATVERVALSAGLEGRFGSRFSYVLSGGYTNYAAGLLDALRVVEYNHDCSPKVLAGVEYMPYQKVYASVQWLWKSENFAADGKVAYADAFGKAFTDRSSCLLPSALSGDVAFEYNYSRRIFAGVDCAFATARTIGSGYVTIPGYADLGLSLEYVTSRNLSVWARVGNLLGMTVQRTPLYAESGVYFTAGICLNL